MATISSFQNLGADERDYSTMGQQDVSSRKHVDSTPIQQGQEMLSDELNKLVGIVKKNWLPLVLSGAGVLVLGSGLTGLLIYRARQRDTFYRQLLKLF